MHDGYRPMPVHSSFQMEIGGKGNIDERWNLAYKEERVKIINKDDLYKRINPENKNPRYVTERLDAEMCGFLEDGDIVAITDSSPYVIGAVGTSGPRSVGCWREASLLSIIYDTTAEINSGLRDV